MSISYFPQELNGMPSEFATVQMKTIDNFINLPKVKDAKISPMLTLLHHFHLYDLLEKIRLVYNGKQNMTHI